MRQLTFQFFVFQRIHRNEMDLIWWWWMPWVMPQFGVTSIGFGETDKSDYNNNETLKEEYGHSIRCSALHSFFYALRLFGAFSSFSFVFLPHDLPSLMFWSAAVVVSLAPLCLPWQLPSHCSALIGPFFTSFTLVNMLNDLHLD